MGCRALLAPAMDAPFVPARASRCSPGCDRRGEPLASPLGWPIRNPGTSMIEAFQAPRGLNPWRRSGIPAMVLTSRTPECG